MRSWRDGLGVRSASRSGSILTRSSSVTGSGPWPGARPAFWPTSFAMRGAGAVRLDRRRAAAAAYVRRHHSPQAVGEEWYRLVNSLLGSGARVAESAPSPAVPSAFGSDNSCEP